MIRTPSRNRASKLSPGLTVGLLLVLPLLFPNRPSVDAAGLARREAVSAALRDAPYRIGPWVGADVVIPPSAVKILHPNATLSRRFKRIGSGITVILLLVHCTDVRDMRGHYPPVCYPYTGWSFAGPQEGREATLAIHGRQVAIRVYEFRRIDSDGRESHIRVFNLFFLPDGMVTPQINQINRLSERLALTTQGVAQMQIVTPIGVGSEDAATAAAEILEGMPGVLSALGLWREGDDK